MFGSKIQAHRAFFWIGIILSVISLLQGFKATPKTYIKLAIGKNIGSITPIIDIYYKKKQVAHLSPSLNPPYELPFDEKFTRVVVRLPSHHLYGELNSSIAPTYQKDKVIYTVNLTSPPASLELSLERCNSFQVKVKSTVPLHMLTAYLVDRETVKKSACIAKSLDSHTWEVYPSVIEKKAYTLHVLAEDLWGRKAEKTLDLDFKLHRAKFLSYSVRSLKRWEEPEGEREVAYLTLVKLSSGEQLLVTASPIKEVYEFAGNVKFTTKKLSDSASNSDYFLELLKFNKDVVENFLNHLPKTTILGKKWMASLSGSIVPASLKYEDKKIKATLYFSDEWIVTVAASNLSSLKKKLRDSWGVDALYPEDASVGVLSCFYLDGDELYADYCTREFCASDLAFGRGIMPHVKLKVPVALTRANVSSIIHNE